MQKIESDNLLSIGAFRRRFFAQGSRPSRRVVERWIEYGTSDGVSLVAYKLDGAYFIKEEDASKFLDASRVSNVSTSDRAKLNAAIALEKLRRMGVRC